VHKELNSPYTVQNQMFTNLVFKPFI